MVRSCCPPLVWIADYADLGISRITPHSPHPLCPSHHLRPLPYLRFPNPRPLPYLRRLYLLHPPPHLPPQSAFIRVIRVIRDSDSFPRPPPYLRFPNPHPLPHLRRLCHLHPAFYLRRPIRVLCPTYSVCICYSLRPTCQPNPRSSA